MAFIHREPGWQPPSGNALIKSAYSRSAEGIQKFVEAMRMLAIEFEKKYGTPPPQ